MFLFCSTCVKNAFRLFPRLFPFFIIAVQTTKNTYHEREEQSHEYRNDDYLCNRRSCRCTEHGLSDDQFSDHHRMEDLSSLQVRIYFVRINRKSKPSAACSFYVSLEGLILTCAHTKFRKKSLLQQVRLKLRTTYPAAF